LIAYKKMTRVPVTTNILRAAAGLFGLGFALIALCMPILGILNLYDESALSSPHQDTHWFLGEVAYALTILSFVLFAALVSAVLLRYARYGKRQARPPLTRPL
jgi:hypothetical protein